MIKLFVSVPMGNRKEYDIRLEMIRALKKAKRILQREDIELMDTYVSEDYTPLECLGISLRYLANCDYAFFCDGWSSARGCCIENKCAHDYGVKILKE